MVLEQYLFQILNHYNVSTGLYFKNYIIDYIMGFFSKAKKGVSVGPYSYSCQPEWQQVVISVIFVRF